MPQYTVKQNEKKSKLYHNHGIKIRPPHAYASNHIHGVGADVDIKTFPNNENEVKNW